MNHNKVAKEIISALHKDNIIAVAHCATRLRIVLDDDEKIEQDKLDNNEDLKGTFKADGQYQIIVGPGDVNKVYAEILKITGLENKSTRDTKSIAAKRKSKNPVMAFIRLLADIFVPIIPALVAGGLIMALNNIFKSQGLFGPESLVEQFPQIGGISGILTILSDAPFLFLPVLVGISGAKRFGANPYLGVTLGLIMTSFELLKVEDGFWDVFGWQITATQYVSQVIPALVAVWVMSFIEKFLHKHLHSAVDFTFTPLITIIVTGFLTFAIIGPVFVQVSDWVTVGLVWLQQTAGFIGMAIFGALYSPIVTTGLHQSFPAFETQLITAWQDGQGNGDFIFVVASMANMAQAAATFAIYFLTKNSKTKGLSMSAGVSALLGITEPALFGVNLKYRFPFFCALFGSAIAAGVAGFFTVVGVSLGSAGVLGFLSINASSIPIFVISEIISFVIAFIITFIYGKIKMAKVFKEEAEDAKKLSEKSEINNE